MENFNFCAVLLLNIFIDWTEIQTSFESDTPNSDDKQSMFKYSAFHFVHLNVNSLLPKRGNTPSCGVNKC